jgi:hypothetical protein
LATQEVTVETAVGSRLDEFARTTSIVAAAIAATLPVYVAVAWLLTDRSDWTPTLSGPTIPVVTWAIAAIAIAELATAEVVFRVMAALAASRDTSTDRLAGYRSAIIVAFALREGAAIMGLVLTLLTGELVWCVALSAGALATMLAGWPKRSAMERLASEVAPIG